MGSFWATTTGVSTGPLSSGARWSLALRGFAAIVFGFIVWIWPAITLHILLVLFGIFLIAAGVFGILAGVKAESSNRRGLLIIEGVLGILAGILTLGWPAITARALLFLIAAWAIVTGVVEIAAAFGAGRAGGREWLLVLSGVVSIIFGILLLVLPVAGILALTWLIGIYAIVYGVTMLMLAFTGGVPAARGRPTEPRQPTTGAVA
jgi:uncharacterized membrane protein HdeD (DUF308 family)